MDISNLSDFLLILFGFLLIVVLAALLLKRDTVIRFLEILSIQISRPIDQPKDSSKQASTDPERQTTQGTSVKVQVRGEAIVKRTGVDSESPCESASVEIDAADRTRVEDTVVKIRGEGHQQEPDGNSVA